MSKPEHLVGLVVGATGDIGRAVLARMSSQYSRVFIVARDTSRLEALAEEYVEGKVVGIAGDATDEIFIRSVIARISEEANRLDSLVNCQGMMPNLAPVEALETDVFNDVFAVNVRSPILFARHALPLLRDSRGSVVFLGSVAGSHANALTGVYGAAKAALTHFAKTIAQEEGPRVRLNVVAPGWVSSTLMQRVLDQFNIGPDAVLSRVPLKRAASPMEVADMVCWLCSAQAGYVSGGVFAIDGGGQP